MRKFLSILALSATLALTGCAHSDDYVTVEFDGTTYACHIVAPGKCKAMVGGLYRTVNFDPSRIR